MMPKTLNMESYFLVVILHFQILISSTFTTDPDLDRKTPQLIKSRGFECEEHFIKTSDGYILGIHRVVRKQFREKGKPVLIWHGLLESSRDFVVNDPNEHINDNNKPDNNLAFYLSKEGYDVWLGNSRGNTYSRNHTKFDADNDNEFWDFTYDEMSSIDLPETIEFILKETGKTELSYIGHSQGGLIMFGLLSSVPKFNDIVKPFIGLAPVTSIKGLESPLKYLMKFPLSDEIVRASGAEFLPGNDIFSMFEQPGCHSLLDMMCFNIIFFIIGFEHDLWNDTRLPVYLSGLPAGTSSKNIVHYIQSGRSDHFLKFNYGLTGNMNKYNSPYAPQYRLRDITNEDIAIFSAENDLLSSPANIQYIRQNIGVELMDDYVVPIKKWNHMDFLYAMDTGKYIHERIGTILAKYNK
jgi:lysosomal acid lipase/cholesteryl ester hydrolase